MGDELDEFVGILQQEILEETRQAYGEQVFARWLDLRDAGAMTEPDGYACLTGVCGDTIQIFLRFRDDRVKEASFLTTGCAVSSVCGSAAAEMARGKTPDELLDITGEAILKRLGGLPKAEEHCAFLAGETLQEALNDYMVKQVREKKTEEEDPKTA